MLFVLFFLIAAGLAIGSSVLAVFAFILGLLSLWMGHGLWCGHRSAKVVGIIWGAWMMLGALVVETTTNVGSVGVLGGIAFVVVIVLPSSGSWFRAHR